MEISPVLRRVRRLPVLGRLAGRGSARATRRVFGTPARELADAAARAGSRVHHYLVEWSAPDSGLGACHCIELPFLFGTRDAWREAPMLAGADWDTDIAPLADRMRAAWSAFVRDGDPGPGWPPHVPGAGPGARFGAPRPGRPQSW